MAILRRLVLLLAFIAPALIAADAARESPIQVKNDLCIDGKPVDSRLEPVIIRWGGRAFAVRVSSPERAEALRKMSPGEALKAIIATNRSLESVVIGEDGAKPR
jgi:hypothetical protein